MKEPRNAPHFYVQKKKKKKKQNKKIYMCKTVDRKPEWPTKKERQKKECERKPKRAIKKLVELRDDLILPRGGT